MKMSQISKTENFSKKSENGHHLPALTNSQRYRVINLAAPSSNQERPSNAVGNLPNPLIPPNNMSALFPSAALNPFAMALANHHTMTRCDSMSMEGQNTDQPTGNGRCMSVASQASSSTDNSSMEVALRPDTTTGSGMAQDGQDDQQVIGLIFLIFEISKLS